MSSLSERVIHWDQCDAHPSLDRPSYSNLYQYIDFRRKNAFSHYHPLYAQRIDFMNRLEQWLDNLKEEPEEQKILFRLLADLLFFGQDEFNALCESAFTEIVIPWLIDKAGVDVFNDHMNARILSAIKETWFCGFTDSMPIASFCHINNIHGCSYRLLWRDAAYFGVSLERIRCHLQSKKYKRIVILEDFIGSGTQITRRPKKMSYSPMEMLCELAKDYPVLLLPLVACPEGIARINKIIEKPTNVNAIKMQSVFTLSYRHFIRRDKCNGGLEDYRKQLSEKDAQCVSEMLRKLDQARSHGTADDDWPFGYEGMGALFAMFTNCPNNTLALFHQDRDKDNLPTWLSLFPRNSRE